MTDLFVYGTLRHIPLLETVLGRAAAGLVMVPATLADHAVRWVAGESWPVLTPRAGAQAEGLLLAGLTRADLDRLDFYEGGFGYTLRDVAVMADGAARSARVYWPPDAAQARAGDAFALADWVARWGDISVCAAQDAMAQMGAVTPQEIARRLPFLRARGWARQLARQTAPQTVRSRLTMADVDLSGAPRRYDGFFRMGGLTLRHKRFDGDWSPRVDREGFIAFDAALVLPYDPASDTVLLIEQLRYGPILRGDPAPWVLEPIAGLVDAGEAPADAARREAVEEAGLTLGDLRPMARVYASPGYSSEFFHCYLGLTDLSGFRAGLGGLETENEDIRSHILPLDDALALIDSGEVNAGPLAMMLLWVAAHRSELRA